MIMSMIFAVDSKHYFARKWAAKRAQGLSLPIFYFSKLGWCWLIRVMELSINHSISEIY